MFTAKDAARILKVSLTTVYRRASQPSRPDYLPPSTLLSPMKFHEETILNALRKCPVKWKRNRPKKRGPKRRGIWASRKVHKRSNSKIYRHATAKVHAVKLLRRGGLKRSKSA